MAESLTANIKLDLTFNFLSALDLTTTQDKEQLLTKIALASGTGANQVDQMWHDRREVTASTGTDDIDILGSLSNAFGTTVSFATVKVVYIKNLGLDNGDGTFTASSGEDLLIGGAGSANDAWSALFNNDNDAILPLGPNDVFLLTNRLDGITVASGDDILRVAHSGTNDITYDIVLMGVRT